MRKLGVDDLDAIALGAAVLGAGGGGDPYIGKLMARAALERHGPIEVLDLAELPDDANCVMVGSMGAPTVAVEKLAGGNELDIALAALSPRIGRITHLLAMEIGGVNSMLPIVAAATSGLPLVDCDGMGRAFPELQMCTPTLAGIAAAPLAIADEKGNAVVIDAVTNAWAERLGRSATIDMGAVSYLAMYPQSGTQARVAMIPGTLALAQRLGEAIADVSSSSAEPAVTVAAAADGHVLFDGKIADVERATVAGFARGRVAVEGIERFRGEAATVEFQNENLLARRGETLLATTPDLIVFVESDSGRPITTEELRYGNRVAVLGIPCDQRWRTPAGVALVGPRYFGFDVDYLPVERRVSR